VGAVSEAGEEFQVCAICARTILRGERASEYLDADHEPALVCALCKPRAEAAGWVPAALAHTVARQPQGRRRSRVGAGLRERLARRSAPKPEPAAVEPEEAERPPREPLEVFNSSPEARQVAGLVRSLGEPRVSVRRSGESAVIVVAWELSWYRWRVRGEEVTELAKGNEISELAAEDRDWNGVAAEDGTISVG
jgi:hypothetical protein